MSSIHWWDHHSIWWDQSLWGHGMQCLRIPRLPQVKKTSKASLGPQNPSKVSFCHHSQWTSLWPTAPSLVAHWLCKVPGCRSMASRGWACGVYKIIALPRSIQKIFIEYSQTLFDWEAWVSGTPHGRGWHFGSFTLLIWSCAKTEPWRCKLSWAKTLKTSKALSLWKSAARGAKAFLAQTTKKRMVCEDAGIYIYHFSGETRFQHCLCGNVGSTLLMC